MSFDISKTEREQAWEQLSKLKDYLAQGYLLHGSKEKINFLEPRQARDVNPERKSGNLVGVYASDSLVPPICKALVARVDNFKSWTYGYFEEGGRARIYGENSTLTPGYVHVLPREKFKKIGEKEGVQYVSEESVEPIDVVPITPEILDFLGNISIELKK